ncbi:MAG: histidinol-phosphate transaminase [Nitrospira bacterium HGW-Nitrospira-1]|nr:MAG: histidinol-phosphate transaminase [Nitrospira bacterium HGW-Nitrospira-1]
MIKPPDYVLGIQPYVPGKPIEELERELGIANSIKLASNENPVGPSPKALEAIKNSLSDINRYPDGAGYYLKKALAEKLSASESICEDEIILGNGSNELLDIAVRTCMQAGDEAVMAVPSFVVYSMAVQGVGGKSIQIPLKDYTHDLKAMADAVTPRTKMIFIANPNNPTGTINRKYEFARMMEEIPNNILVVLDEAYYEYVSDPDYADSMKHLHAEGNVLILRTFSKIYGLAGLRIGYGVAKKEILNDMNRLREPFNTNSIAQRAAIAALKDSEHVSHSRNINEAGKTYLYGELASLGVKYVPTEANFLYMPVEKAMALYESLMKMGVIIRPMGPHAIRVTIGLPEENKRFIEAFKAVVGS